MISNRAENIKKGDPILTTALRAMQDDRFISILSERGFPVEHGPDILNNLKQLEVLPANQGVSAIVRRESILDGIMHGAFLTGVTHLWEINIDTGQRVRFSQPYNISRPHGFVHEFWDEWMKKLGSPTHNIKTEQNHTIFVATHPLETKLAIRFGGLLGNLLGPRATSPLIIATYQNTDSLQILSEFIRDFKDKSITTLLAFIYSPFITPNLSGNTKPSPFIDTVTKRPALRLNDSLKYNVVKINVDKEKHIEFEQSLPP